MEKKIGILFDLDGTLLDTLQDLTDATNYTLRHFGLPEHTTESMRRILGNGALYQLTISRPEGATEPDPNEMLKVYLPYYEANSKNKTKPYDGIPEALAEVAKKYPVAIVSNKPDSAVKLLCADYFPGYYALGQSDECPRKPAPDMVYKAMKDMGVDSCIFVGDSEVDVFTANNAGVPCLTVLWGFRDRDMLEENGAKYFCDDTAKLLSCIEEIVNG